MWEPIDEPSRINFFAGRLVTAEDLTSEQSSSRERQWRHNRLLHGFGVVTGLEVTVEDDSIVVSPGLAIDPLGREVVLTASQRLDCASVGRQPQRRLDVAIAWAEEPADEVPGPDGAVPGRFVERPRVLLAEHPHGDTAQHAVRLARLGRQDHQLHADPSVRRQVRHCWE
ncbi:MAG: hypothetical protein ABIS35_01480 [Terracoccus sp.]